VGTPDAAAKGELTLGVGSSETLEDGSPYPTCRCGCGRTPNGQTRHDRPYHVDCYRAWKTRVSREVRQSNHRLMVELLGETCIDCGGTYKLRFAYHRPPGSGDLRPPGRFMQSSLAVLLPQILDADLVCDSCEKRRRSRGVPNSERHVKRRTKAQLMVVLLMIECGLLRMDEADNILES
jgi:hypothetical protein